MLMSKTPQFIVLNKDPDSYEDYTVDWRDRFQGTEIITNVDWFIDPLYEEGLNGLEHVDDSLEPQFVTIWLSGGIVGVHYTVTCRVVTNLGRSYDYSFKVYVTEL